MPPARLQVAAFPRPELTATGSGLTSGSFAFSHQSAKEGQRIQRIFNPGNTKQEKQSIVIAPRP